MSPRKTDAERRKINDRIEIGQLRSRAAKLDVLEAARVDGTLDRGLLEAFGRSEWSRGWDDCGKELAE